MDKKFKLMIFLSISIFMIMAIPNENLVTSQTNNQNNCPEGSYDFTKFYPFNENYGLHYQSYHKNNTEEDLHSVIYTDKWGPNNNYFTIHHTYGSSTKKRTWCPRVADIFKWEGNNLYYTETKDFYKGLSTTFPSNNHAGHLWGEKCFKANVAKKISTTQRANFYRDHKPNSCNLGTAIKDSRSHNVDIWRALKEDYTAWSDFTGGKNNPVEVLRLDETTIYGNNNWWKESWYFYDHPEYGVIPIHSKGLRKMPNTNVELLWNMRLKNIHVK